MIRVLDTIDSPRDLQPLSQADLQRLCEEVRQQIIETVSCTGGHLAANLGVVELTVALLRVFSPPRDKILWDVSHQVYTYKLLTGRRDRFGTLRQYKGLSGFLKRAESDYDAFGAGHAGTALSAALGMAAARDRRGSGEEVIAVMGDAAAGCGISFEALNNLAATTRKVIVVLNDNEMSIAANVGSISRYLGTLLSNPRYNRWKRSVEHLAAERLHMGWLRSLYYWSEEALKGLFLKSVIFEEFGLRYIGPIDGHDLHALQDALSIAHDYDRPVILHVSTQKGRGYPFAEKQPTRWHGTPAFDVVSGCREIPEAALPAPSYSQAAGTALVKLAEETPQLVAITAAMQDGTGLSSFAARFPERFYDVGICEEHAVVFAAGLATEGLLPVFAVYSTFLQRSIDCVIHDVCLQNLPVIFCIDRAGIVGDDGPTHHGVFDIALLRPVPGLILMQPCDQAELCAMLRTAVELRQPVAIRYPRGCGPAAELPETFERLEIGRADVLCDGDQVCFWALGDMIATARAVAAELAADGISAGVVNARFVRPLDRELLALHSRRYRVMVTLENGVGTGGFGEAVALVLQEHGFQGRLERVAWPDEFIEQGDPASLFKQYGLDVAAIGQRVRAALAAVSEPSAGGC